MKNLGKKIICVFICALLLSFTAVSLTACGPDSGATEYTVTFDYNYTGAPTSTTQKVAKGKTATKPADPSREGYSFDGWYTTSAATAKYEFTTSVNSDVTIYAGWKVSGYTVTFNLNYTGAPAPTTAVVSEGGKATEPTAPTRDGWIFDGWYTDTACTSLYSFGSDVTNNVTLYAKWIDNSKDYKKVTFNYNYEGAPQAQVVNVENGQVATALSVDDRKTKLSSGDEKNRSYDFIVAKFGGWYTSSALTQKFNFANPITADTTVYAKWTTTYTFEAELTDLTDKTGTGYSFGVNDEELIREDSESRNQKASMGYSVGYLYITGLSVEFKVYSSVAVDNVNFTARLSSEYRDALLAPVEKVIGDVTYDSFEIKVNDTAINYDPIALTGAVAQLMPNQRPFDNWDIGMISLKEGWNEIKMTVTNANYFESTIAAAAPMIDCIYLATEGATLSWEPKWGNLDKVTSFET